MLGCSCPECPSTVAPGVQGAGAVTLTERTASPAQWTMATNATKADSPGLCQGSALFQAFCV